MRMIHDQLKQLRLIILMLIVCFSISSCMMGGIAVSGAQAVYDRHSIQKKLDDNFTSMQAYRAIYLKTDKYKNTNISIATYNDTVLITGQTPEVGQKNEITQLVKNLANERKVYNFAEIASPSSVLTRTSDTWITSKIKAKMIATNNIDPTKIKVVTENGTVFLMGIVPKEDADTAVDIAQNTSGVQSIVKIFSYLEIAKV
jgi:osmotically-inducible protein OsmY